MEKVFINGHFFQDLNPIRKVGQEGLIFQLKFDPRIEEDQIISMKNVHQIQICYSALSSAYAFKKAIELLVEADLKNCHELGIRMGDYSSKFFNNTTILILTEIFLKRYQSNFKKLTFDNSGLGNSHTNHYILDTAKFDSLESLKIHNLDSINRLDEFLITHPKVTSLHLHTFDFPLKILQHENNYYKKRRAPMIFKELILENGRNFRRKDLASIPNVFRNLKNCYIVTLEDNPEEWSLRKLKRTVQKKFHLETKVTVVIGNRLIVCKEASSFKVESLKEDNDDDSDTDGEKEIKLKTLKDMLKPLVVKRNFASRSTTPQPFEL